MPKDIPHPKPAKSAFAASPCLKECAYYFNLPIQEASQKLNVSRPTISKVLRKNGIKRWPYRKISSKAIVGLGTFHNWNEATAMAVLEILKTEKTKNRESLARGSSDDGDGSQYVPELALTAAPRSSSLKNGNLSSTHDLKSGTNIISSENNNNNIKNNNKTNSFKLSQQNSRFSMSQQLRNMQCNSDNIIYNVKNTDTATKSQNISQDRLISPDSTTPSLSPSSIPQHLRQGPEISFNFRNSKTKFDPSHGHSNKHPVCIACPESLDCFPHESNNSFRSQSHYIDVIPGFSNMAVAKKVQTVGVKDVSDGVPMSLTQISRMKCADVVKYRPIASMSGNKFEKSLSNMEVPQAESGTESNNRRNALELNNKVDDFISLKPSSAPCNNLFGFGNDENDIQLSSYVNNFDRTCDENLLFSSRTLHPLFETKSIYMDKKANNYVENLRRIQFIDDYSITNIETDPFSGARYE